MTDEALYFAHPINVYDTPVEGAAIELILDAFPDAEIENPNQQKHQVGYVDMGMDYFYGLVLPGCTGCVAMTFLDGRMSLGVAGEAKWFLEHSLPVWGMFPDPINGLFVIREFCDDERQQLLERRAPLVLSHAETRQRVWSVYGEKLRPYRESHLVGIEK